jgi:hypothetical protein
MNFDELPHEVRQAYTEALELRLRRARGDGLQKFLGDVFERAEGANFLRASAFYSKEERQTIFAQLRRNRPRLWC